jgi:hypothetical protein
MRWKRVVGALLQSNAQMSHSYFLVYCCHSGACGSKACAYMINESCSNSSSHTLMLRQDPRTQNPVCGHVQDICAIFKNKVFMACNLHFSHYRQKTSSTVLLGCWEGEQITVTMPLIAASIVCISLNT